MGPDANHHDADAMFAPEHLRLALEAGELGTWRWNRRTGHMVWDARLERLFGMEPGSFDGEAQTWLDHVHPDDRDEVNRIIEAGAPYTVRHRVVWPDGSEHWLEGRAHPLLDEHGEIYGNLGCARDITDSVLAASAQQAQIEQMAAVADMERLNRERLEFLLQVNDALASTTDLRQVMRRATAVAVPRLGDWCLIHVMPPDGSPHPEVAAAHADEEMLSGLRRVAHRLPFDPDAPMGVPAVIRTGRREFYPSVDVSHAEGLTEDERRIFGSAGLRSTMIVPIRRHKRIYGALTFATTGASRSYTDEDLFLAEAVAGRIASAVENLRLMEQQSEIARVLQASLLPDDLPDVSGFDVAVRYMSCGEGMQVGGDFYDVFEVTAQSWGVAIGDVCGKGPGAAALTALARHTIRTSAWRGDDPETVLARLNQAVHQSGRGTYCTALYGVLVPATRRLLVASGGHPLPILVHPDGRAEIVGEPGMLLGAFPVQRSTASEIELPAGTQLVLYTDGVTDIPPPDGLAPEEFADVVSRCAREARDAEQLANLIDETLDAIRPSTARTDDIALVVISSRS